MTDKERMDRIRSRKSVPVPLVIILRAHFYTGYSPYVRSARPPPGHLNVRAVLRHYVPSKGLHPLRRYAAIPAGRQKILAVIFIPIFQEVTLIVNAKITIPAGSRTSLL